MASKIQVMYLVGSLTLPGPTGVAYNMDRICILEKGHKSAAWTLCARG